MKQLTFFKKRKRTKGKVWGRPVTTKSGVRLKREEFKANFPLHLTLRLRDGLPNLRSRMGSQIIKNAIFGAHKVGIRIVHFAILSNHVHLVVEGGDQETLSRAMKSFCSRIGIHLRRHANVTVLRTLDQAGQGLFRGRYHVQILKSAQQVKNALKYVLMNPAKHFAKKSYIDAYTTGAIFTEWRKLLGRAPPCAFPTEVLQKRLLKVVQPSTLWLLRSGWCRAG